MKAFHCKLSKEMLVFCLLLNRVALNKFSAFQDIQEMSVLNDQNWQIRQLWAASHRLGNSLVIKN